MGKKELSLRKISITYGQLLRVAVGTFWLHFDTGQCWALLTEPTLRHLLPCHRDPTRHTKLGGDTISTSDPKGPKYCATPYDVIYATIKLQGVGQDPGAATAQRLPGYQLAASMQLHCASFNYFYFNDFSLNQWILALSSSWILSPVMLWESERMAVWHLAACQVKLQPAVIQKEPKTKTRKFWKWLSS